MTTPLIVLFLLFAPLLLLGLWRADWQTGGVVGLVAAFSFFALGHFVRTGPMTEMLPPFVPQRELLVWTTGLLELVVALGLALPRWRKHAGWAAIVVLVGFFPANIYAAINHTGMGGHQWGPEYLLVRAPLQALLIYWAYRFAVLGRLPGRKR